MIFRPHYFILLLLLIQMSAANPLESDALDRFRWEHRILLISTQEPLSGSLLDELNQASGPIRERHLLWFLFSGEDVVTNYPGILEEKFEKALRHFYRNRSHSKHSVLLIGKDGGIKARQSRLDLKALFNRIDSMPMRQREMREQDGPGG